MNSTVFSGNLTRDPELRTGASGKARVNFTVAVNTGERGTDSEKVHFIPVTAFGQLAENVAASLGKGQRVVVAGRFDNYKKPVQVDGKDLSLEMVAFVATEVGASLVFATADITRTAPAEHTARPQAAPARPAPAAQTRVIEDDDF